MSKPKIEPNLILCIIVDSYSIIKLCIRNIEGELLYISNIIGLGLSQYEIRQQALNSITSLLDKYPIDTLIMEKTNLFTDGITFNPDWRTYSNVLLNYSLQITLDDNFHKTFDNFLVIPGNDWTKTVLNNNQLKSFDAYKKHILLQTDNFTSEQFNIFQQNNFYKLLCFSECVHFTNLMSTKYLINKGDSSEEE